MPSSPNYKRNYKQEYKTSLARGEDKGNSLRHKARREYEKIHGDLPTTTEVDHKKHVATGGTNAPSNLRARPESANRADNGHHKGEKQKGKK